jgi:glycerophosphoryl diester phosphodiesterase
MIEMKTPGMTAAVTATVAGCGFQGQLLYASFLHQELLAARKQHPSASTVALLEGVLVDQTAFAKDAQATHVALAIESLGASFVRNLHDAGFAVFTYTADLAEDIAYAKSCNVDGIISNYPDRI